MLPSEDLNVVAGFAFEIKNNEVALLGRVAKAREAKAIIKVKQAAQQAQAERLEQSHADLSAAFSNTDWMA